MALNAVLVLSATLALAAQDPSLDNQIATPVLNSVGTAQGASVSTTQSKVTVQFRGVKASEVFSWLENRGVNFVVSSGDIPTDTTVTLNLQDVTLDTAMDSIARALNGHWERERGVYVFKKGVSFFGGPDVAIARGLSGRAPSVLSEDITVRALPGMPAMPPMPAMPAMPDIKVWGDFKPMTPEQQKEWEKKFGPEFQQKMEKWSKEFAKNMERMSKDMEQKFGDDSVFAKQMRDLADREVRVYRSNGDGPFKVDRVEIERLRKQALEEGQRARAEGAKARAEGDRARSEARREIESSRVFVSPQGKGGTFFVRPGQSADIRVFRSGDSHSEGTVDISKFLKNLTSDQRDKQRKRGYIWWDDLSREQQAQFGGRPDGKFEIHYKVNGDEVTIRGN